jgi:hypothetical protein
MPQNIGPSGPFRNIGDGVMAAVVVAVVAVVASG